MEPNLKDILEVACVIWMPTLGQLAQNGGKCPSHPEQGLCPCRDFVERLECRCGLFTVTHAYRNVETRRVKRINFHDVL